VLLLLLLRLSLEGSTFELVMDRSFNSQTFERTNFRADNGYKMFTVNFSKLKID